MQRSLLALLLSCSLLSGAELHFPEKSKEITPAATAKVLTTEFPFTNDSDQPITVRRLDGGCSCMAVQLKDPKKTVYAPGESGVVTADFELGTFSGTVDRAIAVWLNDDPESKPSAQLKVRVHIPVVVSMEPKTLKWNIGAKPEPQTIQIRMNHSKPVNILRFSESTSAFKHELKTIEAGKHYELTVTPVGTEAPGIDVIRIETDCDIARHKNQQAFAVVRRPVPGEAASAR